MHWIGSSGNWTDTSHWDTGLVPVAGDEVIIDTGGGAATISITTGAQAADSIVMTGNDHLAISGGSLTLTQASDINDLQMTGGIFTSSLLSTLTGTGTLSNIATWHGLIRNDATLTITGTPSLGDVTLDNTGTILDNGGRLDLSGNVTINNTTGRLFDLTGNGDFSFLNNVGAGTVLFHNAGTLQRSGTGIAQFNSVPFQNDAGATINITAGTLLVNTSGTMAAGPLSITAGAALRFDASTYLTLSGNYTSTGTGHVDFTSGTLDLGSGTGGFGFGAGVFTTSGGTATFQNGVLNNTGTIQFASGSDPNFANMILNNTGTIKDGGRLDLGGNTTVNNLGGALFDLNFTGDYSFLNNLAGTNNHFHNAGTLRRSTTGTAQFNAIPLQNDAGATIDLTAGNLLVNTSGTFAAGTLSIATGSALQFDAGTNLTLSGNFTSSGAGHVDMTAGTLDLAFGTVGFGFGAGVFTMSGGTATIQNGTLNNTGTIQFASGSDPNLAVLTLNNSGAIKDGGRLDLFGNTTINNQSTGIFDINAAGDYSFLNIAAGTSNLFHNAGTLRRSNTGIAQFNAVPFQNDAGASIDITAGTLLVNTSGTLAAGPLSIATGSTLRFDAGTNLTLSGNFASTGAGTVDITGGTFDLGSGTVGFNFVAGVFSMSGSSTTIQNGTLNNGGTMRFADGSDPNLINVTLNNSNTITDGGRLDLGGNVAINNQAGALFDASFTGDYAFLNVLSGQNNVFHNAGTLRRTSTGTARLDGISLDNTGTVMVQAGVFNLNAAVTQVSGTTLTGGTWDVSTGAGLLFPGVTFATNSGNVTLRGTANAPAFDGLGSNTGSLALLAGRDLTTPADFSTSGTLTMGPRSILTVNGAFTQSAAGTIGLQLGGTPASLQFGKITASGSATLAGTAGFSITDGYVPTNGDAFTLMTFPSHSGTFATYTGLVPATGVYLTPATTATNFGVNILVDNTPPTSSVTAFPVATTNRPNFYLNWSGSDNAGGAGLAGFDVYVSDNNGPFTQYLTGVLTTSTVFTGVLDHTYAFYTRATDLVDNVEAAPLTPDATITVHRTPIAVGKAHTFTDTDGDTYTVKLAGPGTLNAVLFDPAGTGKGPLDYLLADGTTTKSSITIAVTKNKAGGDGIVNIGDVIGTGALGSFTATASNLIMNGFNFAGAVKTIKLRDVLVTDPMLATPAIMVGGTATDKLAITVQNLANTTAIQTPATISTLTAANIGTGTIAAAGIGKLKVAAGALAANLQVAGGIGSITVNGDGVSGTLVAHHFGSISVTDGNFSGQLTSTATPATLGKTLALTSLKVTGGNLTGAIRVLGKAGPISVTASKLGVGGNFLGATVNASAIGNVTVSKNFTDSNVLAGADLGADHEFGGGNDTFAAGTMGVVKIGGNVTGTRSLIGAGFSRVGAVDTIIGGPASSIAGLTVTGTADANLHFAAGQFKGKPRIGNVVVDPTTDSRFLVG